jgi:hypothetical protein
VVYIIYLFNLAELYGNTYLNDSALECIHNSKLKKTSEILKKHKRSTVKRLKKNTEEVVQKNELSFETFLKKNNEFSQEMERLAAYEMEILSHKLIEGPEVDHLYI